jgi:hypothetical protein
MIPVFKDIFSLETYLKKLFQDFIFEKSYGCSQRTTQVFASKELPLAEDRKDEKDYSPSAGPFGLGASPRVDMRPG